MIYPEDYWWMGPLLRLHEWLGWQRERLYYLFHKRPTPRPIRREEMNALYLRILEDISSSWNRPA